MSPCDYKLYPKDWPQIRARILERDGHKCKDCGVPNYARGMRHPKTGEWVDAGQLQEYPWAIEPDEHSRNFRPLVKIVLTVAHLDHDLSHNTDDNLAALCQRCHLKHDQDHHQANAKATRDRKRGQLDLLDGEPGLL